jgi:chromosome segregation ATPase
VDASNGKGATMAARILVDLEAEKAAHTPRRRPNKHPDERRTFEVIQDHIATLKEAVAKAEAVGEQYRQEADMAGKRVDHLVTELVEMSMRMAEQAAVADKVRAEFDAYRARPWWRRLARSAA